MPNGHCFVVIKLRNTLVDHLRLYANTNELNDYFVWYVDFIKLLIFYNICNIILTDTKTEILF